MSGSSLDGLDICYAEIKTGEPFTYSLLYAETIAYTRDQLIRIKNFNKDPHADHTADDAFMAGIFADCVNRFVHRHAIKTIDFISSHGHTLFHYPEQGITCQLGDGKIIAEKTGQEVIWNFRQADIDAGGQGAPLVPVCDAYFFPHYDACLNIGGIANISYRQNGERIGFDICAANQLLNYGASLCDLEYDKDGMLAAGGSVNTTLLEKMNNVPVFLRTGPVSLDNNFIRDTFIPMLQKSGISIADQLATSVEHIAMQIGRIIRRQIEVNHLDPDNYRILVTGGGAFNSFLISRLIKYSGIRIQLPETTLINFKEALAMCLMGVLRKENIPNFLPSVTGAKYPVCGGDIANKNEF